jgi:hypothetical protein
MTYLRSVRVWSSIGHGQNSFTHMFQLKVFILKLVAVNRLATRSLGGGRERNKNVFKIQRGASVSFLEYCSKVRGEYRFDVTLTVVVSEVSSLAHEIRNYSVK